MIEHKRITGLNEYQEITGQTAIYPKDGLQGLYYTIMALSGEVGEISNKVSKILRDSTGIMSEEIRKDLCKECGDCFWNLSELATNLGISLEDVANENRDKLFSRKERGVIGGSGDNR